MGRFAVCRSLQVIIHSCLAQKTQVFRSITATVTSQRVISEFTRQDTCSATDGEVEQASTVSAAL